MNPTRILVPFLCAAVFSSCASRKDNYDTPGTYGTPDPGYANATPTAPENPVYDSPAAYEESSQSPVPAAPDVTAAAPVAPANGAAIIHTVVKGDTLSGLSAKYKVPIASIKQANRMTNDTVVLGRKMVIPPQ
jgi:LysM repeat protein